jgi:HTH-type transcriptional regulator/antitoxin HigA
VNIDLIKTQASYKAALKEVSALVDMDPAEGTDEGDRLEVLSLLVEAYEAKHFPINAPDAIEAIKFRMEQNGLTANDMVKFIGAKNRTYEVLAKKRPLSISMIRRLHSGLGIPAEVLIKVST